MNHDLGMESSPGHGEGGWNQEWDSFEQGLAATLARHANDPFHASPRAEPRQRWPRLAGVAAAILLIVVFAAYRPVTFGGSDATTVAATDPGPDLPNGPTVDDNASLSPSPQEALPAAAEMTPPGKDGERWPEQQWSEPRPIDQAWLDAAATADHSDSEPYFNRAVGTAERQGRIFFGSATEWSDDCPTGTSTPIFGQGSSDSLLVGSVPGPSISAMRVSWAGNGFATVRCGDSIIFWSAKFDGNRFDLSTARAWAVDTGDRVAPRVEWVSAREVRWGVWALDLPTGTWTCDPAPDIRGHHGTSDSGRFFYWSATGPHWESVGIADAPSEHARVLVTDTVTGRTRELTNSNLGVDARHGFLFGPGDEVAWYSGNELGSSAYLGRIDWSTGELTEVWALLTGPDAPYWGHPGSDTGRPGADGIAFEADGTLRAWAYTDTEDNRDDPRVETLTYRLDELDGSTATRLPAS